MSDINKQEDVHGSSMSLGDHLEELRKRLIYAIAGLAVCAIIGFCFGSRVIHFIEAPYNDVLPEVRLQTLAPTDGFVSYIKVAMITGLALSSPWVFYHMWMFVAAGLYPHEKKYVYLAAPFSAILFVGGAVFFVVVVLPLTLGFLVKFNSNFLGVNSQFTFQHYIAFVTHLMLVFGLAFQTPTAIFFLNRTGLVSLKALCSSRKYVLLAVFVVAAMATPPDVVSQITLAVPLYALFEFGILISYLVGRKKEKAQKHD